MTGLDKILKHIEENSTATADAVINKAKNEADKIIADGMADGKQRCAEIKKQSELNVRATMSRAQSAASLQEKKLILEAKQQIIADVITSAKDFLINLSDEEYFKYIISMIKRYALPEAGQILFSKKDYNRLPEQFEDFINSSLNDKIGAALTISKETSNIDGGFILIYGDVEVNCSFDALFFAAKENLQDKVRALLFE